jgi:hypothetical protein
VVPAYEDVLRLRRRFEALLSTHPEKSKLIEEWTAEELSAVTPE